MDTETLERFEKYIDKTGECWLWTGYCNTRHGYGQFRIEGKIWRTHRLMYLHCYGELPEYPFVICHKCSNRNCCNPEHLESEPQSKNNGPDKHRDGTMAQAKLTAEQVLEIRQRSDKNQTELALEYGVSKVTISEIIRRKNWTHI